MTERACTHYTHTHTHIYYPLSTFLSTGLSSETHLLLSTVRASNFTHGFCGRESVFCPYFSCWISPKLLVIIKMTWRGFSTSCRLSLGLHSKHQQGAIHLPLPVPLKSAAGAARQGQGHGDTITKVGGRVPPSCPQYTGGPHTQVFKENDGLSLFCR